MSNSFSLLNRANGIPNIWRYFLLFVASQIFLSFQLKEKIQYYLRAQRESEGKSYELVEWAKPSKYWIASLFLGHFADIKPWLGGDIVFKMLQERFNWYKRKDGTSADNVRVRIIQTDFVFSKDRELVRSFCGKEDGVLRNSDTVRSAWGTLFPKSVVVLTGDKWKRVRRVLVSAIYKIDYEQLPRSTNVVLKEGLDNYILEDSKTVVLWDIFAKITFDSFHKFMYGINFGTISGNNLEVLSDLMEIASNVSNRLLMPLDIIWKLPLESNRILFTRHKRLLKFVDGYIDERMKEIEEEDGKPKEENQTFRNLLDALIFAATEEPNVNKQLSREEIRTQLCAAMFGGFDTTTSSMSFIAINLANHPESQEKLYEEVKHLDLANVTKHELGSLPYLNGVIRETQRIRTVAPAVARIPNEDIVVNGKLFKEGTNIILDHESLGKVPEYWNNAQDLDEFKPERWIGFELTPHTFFPFGFGGRMCPGYKVANTQMQAITAYIVQNYKISLSNKPPKYRCSLGMTVTADTELVFSKRK